MRPDSPHSGLSCARPRPARRAAALTMNVLTSVGAQQPAGRLAFHVDHHAADQIGRGRGGHAELAGGPCGFQA